MESVESLLGSTGDVKQEGDPLPTVKNPSSSLNKLFWGLVIVCLIACSWVGSTQTAKSAYTGNFKAPFFSMWFGTAWMMVLFPLSAVPFSITRKGTMKDLWR